MEDLVWNASLVSILDNPHDFMSDSSVSHPRVMWCGRDVSWQSGSLDTSFPPSGNQMSCGVQQDIGTHTKCRQFVAASSSP